MSDEAVERKTVAEKLREIAMADMKPGPATTYEVKIMVMDVSERLIMRVHAGEGHIRDIPLEVSISLADSAPIFEIGEGEDRRVYMVSMESLIRAIAEQVYFNEEI